MENSESNDKNDGKVFLWIQSASQYSVLFLTCIILLTLLFIGTKDKININFSKKSNRYVLIGVLLVLAYIFQDKFSGLYDELKKDAINPGDGVIGKSINNGKSKILAMNDGYLGDQIDPLLQYYNSTNIDLESEQSINKNIIKQLKNEGVLGYLITDEGKFYSIKRNKFKRDKYVLESKINRDNMKVKVISINSTDSEYIKVISSKKYVESLSDTININTILVEPDLTYSYLS